MRKLRSVLSILAAAAFLLGAGCGRNDDVALVPETEDANYKLGKQLQRHGRSGEALNAYLKVIETRGARAAPESHLEAGAIYLHHSKNPIEAIHHFNKYLELRPNSPQAPGVRDLVSTATREFALRLPARPFDDQSVRVAENKEIEKLRRENEELRAELATLRGGGAAPMPRPAAPSLAADPQRSRTPLGAASVDSPITVAPGPVNLPGPRVTSPATAQPPPATTKSAARPAPANRPVANAPRSHTVAPRESLWSIARKYYGDQVSAARVNAIYEANRDVMSSQSDLKIGMTLRIP